MAYDLIESAQLLAASARNFAHHLIAGLGVDREKATGFVEESLAMGTALAPEIGYEKAAALVKNAYKTGRTIRTVAIEQSGLTPERVKELLDPETQAG
jgi:fumarate hydratase, class II